MQTYSQIKGYLCREYEVGFNCIGIYRQIYREKINVGLHIKFHRSVDQEFKGSASIKLRGGTIVLE